MSRRLFLIKSIAAGLGFLAISAPANAKKSRLLTFTSPFSQFHFRVSVGFPFSEFGKDHRCTFLARGFPKNFDVSVKAIRKYRRNRMRLNQQVSYQKYLYKLNPIEFSINILTEQVRWEVEFVPVF